MWQYVIIIIGLILFEVISSVDNAIINAHVLKTVSEKYRKIFLFWGILFAVFIVRGGLPFLIVWLANTHLTASQVFLFALSGDPTIQQYVHNTTPLLLLGGGVYLTLVFLSWLFLEEKNYAFMVESFIHRQAIWFYALTSLLLTVVVYIGLQINPLLALSATIGSAAFFITDGFKKNAEEKGNQLMSKSMSAWSKLLYLELLDLSFSIDGVIGAFAFTLSIPLILIGNGIGAFIVREVTVKGIDVIAKLAYLKNGAMYSIGVLGTLMVLESFGREYPFWLAPLNTTALLVFFLYLSIKELRLADQGKLKH